MERRPGMLKKQTSYGTGICPDIAWKASPDGEKTLRDRLRECKAGESHFYLLIGKLQDSFDPEQHGTLTRILVVGM